MWERIWKWLSGSQPATVPKEYDYCYFISYFRPNTGFFNVTVKYPVPIREQADVRALEVAIMGGEVPDDEEEQVTIINVSFLDKVERDTE